MNDSDIKNAYHEVFPLSHISITQSVLGGSAQYIKCYIQNNTDWANAISHNDPLNYMFSIDETGVYSEHNLSIQVKPKNKYMFASSELLRKKTIKNINYQKLIARFTAIKHFIISNQDNMIIDIKNKL